MDVQVRSIDETKARVVDGATVEEKVTTFELFTAGTINGQPIEYRKRYEIEPTNEQRAAFEGEARQHFERNAKREGVTLDDPGVTPAAQPVHEHGPAAHTKKSKGTTAKK